MINPIQSIGERENSKPRYETHWQRRRGSEGRPEFDLLAGGGVVHDRCSAITETAIGNLLPA